MKEMTIGKLKVDFSRIMDEVAAGEEYTVLRGRTREKIAVIKACKGKKNVSDLLTKQKRILGRDKGKIEIKPDFNELPEDIMKSLW
jgi:antitoxin (DNA-binding transcriptional repressor) of toxin-antitoxin stability system